MRQCVPGSGAAALVALLVLAGCNRTPAQEALAEAEETLAASRPALSETDSRAFEGALEQARAALDEGHYTDALRITQDLPSHIRSALEREAAKGRAAPVEEKPEPDPMAPMGEPAPTPSPAVGIEADSTAAGS